MLVEEKTMANCKQVEFENSAFPGYENFISKNLGPEGGELSLVPASHTGKRMETRRLRPEQKSNSLLREAVFRFSQPEGPVVKLS